MNDPTRKDNGVADIAHRRPMGGILITWDPNTGGIDVKVNAISPVEEIGLLQWVISLRMGSHLKLLPEQNVSIAQPGQMPPPPKVS